jgi:hypothetical protein
MDEVLRRSDYVVVSMPATSDTIGSIDRTRLRLMKSTAVLVNVARAEIVDEDALYGLSRSVRSPVRHSMSGIAIPASWVPLPRRHALSTSCRMC